MRLLIFVSVLAVLVCMGVLIASLVMSNRNKNRPNKYHQN